MRKTFKFSEASIGCLPFSKGIALLEVLVSILIVTCGVLGFIGLQSKALGYVDESGYRGQAVQLAGAYAADLWVLGAQGVGSEFGDGGSPLSPYATFKDKVQEQLPRAAEAAGILGAGVKNPTVTVSSSPQGAVVVIKIYWMMPGDSSNAAGVHRYEQVTVLGFNS